MENIRIKAILAVVVQYVLDHYRDSYQVTGIDQQFEHLTVRSKNSKIENVGVEFVADGRYLLSVPAAAEKWMLQLPCDVQTLAGWFDQLSPDEQFTVKQIGNLRPVLTLWQADEPLVIHMPYALNCLKLARAMHGVPQIITDADYDEIKPVLAAGWQLVTMNNPDQVGTLDTLLLVRKDHPIALEARSHLYGDIDRLTEQEIV